jgi:TM2 domain-containing membrane protein YozV
MAKVTKTKDHKFWRGCAGETLIHFWCNCKLVQPLWKSVWRILKNLYINLSYLPAISKVLAFYFTDTCLAMYIIAELTHNR